MSTKLFGREFSIFSWILKHDFHQFFHLKTQKCKIIICGNCNQQLKVNRIGLSSIVLDFGRLVRRPHSKIDVRFCSIALYSIERFDWILVWLFSIRYAGTFLDGKRIIDKVSNSKNRLVDSLSISMCHRL